MNGVDFEFELPNYDVLITIPPAVEYYRNKYTVLSACKTHLFRLKYLINLIHLIFAF